MGPFKASPTPNESSRRWRVPPALEHDVGGDVLDGVEVLRDLGGGPLSVVLWQGAREVMLWGRADERVGLFAPGAHRRRLGVLRELEVPGEVAPLLRGLSEAVLMEPELAESEYVTAVCRQVSAWAMDAGAGETGLLYAQAAAVASPRHAPTALEAGRIALRLGKLQRAESWLLRAVGLARKRDWNTYALAFVELARASEQRCDRPTARRRLIRALRTSRRTGLRDVRGKALHGLLRLALDEGALNDAARYASVARNRIARNDPGWVSVHADYAALLIRSGETKKGLSLLRNLLDVSAPAERMYLLALQALAHAQEEDRAQSLAESWTAAWDHASVNQGADLHVRTLLILAEAARRARNVRIAQQAEDAARASMRTGLDRWLVAQHAVRTGAHTAT